MGSFVRSGSQWMSIDTAVLVQGDVSPTSKTIIVNAGRCSSEEYAALSNAGLIGEFAYSERRELMKAIMAVRQQYTSYVYCLFRPFFAWRSVEHPEYVVHRNSEDGRWVVMNDNIATGFYAANDSYKTRDAAVTAALQQRVPQ